MLFNKELLKDNHTILKYDKKKIEFQSVKLF